jgi:hypothetical protein
MPIIDLQRRVHEVGRIRIGHQIPTTKGTRPAKLETFRLTSASHALIDEVADLYGGTPNQWEAPAGQQWEVITTASVLPVIVPPTELAFSQWYELWAASGCQRRCDGATATYNDGGNIQEGECLCDPDNRECAIHTRLSVMLAKLNGLGLWRIESQGYNAAAELQGAVHVIEMAARRGELLPAVLRLEQRVTKRPGQGTRRFAVPVLDITVTPAQLFSGTGLQPTPPPAAIDRAAALTPVPQPNGNTAPSIAEQIATKPPPKKRRTPTIPETGLEPRTADQFQHATAGTDVGGGDRPPKPGTPATDPDLIDHIQRAQQTWNDTYDRITREPDPYRQTMADNHAMGSDPTTVTVTAHTQPEPPMTAKQRRNIFALLNKLDVTTRDDQLIIISDVVGYPLDSRTAVTISEATRVIDTLQDVWPADEDYLIGDRIRDLLNTAALKDAENQGELFDDGQPHD